jgi:hypothetical protein
MEHLSQAVPAGIVEGWGRIMPWLDIAAIAVFGISGALAAAQMRKTLVTFMFCRCYRRWRRHLARSADRRAGVLDALLAADRGVPGVGLRGMVHPRGFWPAHALEWVDGVGLAAYSVFGAARRCNGAFRRCPPR